MGDAERRPCGFCEHYITIIAVNLETWPPERIRYHALFLSQVRSENGNGWRACGTTHYHNGHGWPLRFCPECGRSLDRRKLGKEIEARKAEIRRLFERGR